MPAVEYCRRQRAISPSEQSSRIWTWISSTAATAGSTPGSVSTAAAASPATIIAPVTRVRRSTGSGGSAASDTARGGARRAGRPSARRCCARRSTAAASPRAAQRSKASRNARTRSLTSVFVEAEVLEDRVAVGPGRRRVQHRLHELLLRQAEVGRRARQPVTVQAGVDRRAPARVAAQERREQARGAGQLAVARGAGKQVVDRVQDLVVAAAARAAASRPSPSRGRRARAPRRARSGSRRRRSRPCGAGPPSRRCGRT